MGHSESREAIETKFMENLKIRSCPSIKGMKDLVKEGIVYAETAKKERT